MKVVLAGQSRYSENLKTALADYGFEAISVRTASELKTLPESLPVVILYDAKIHPAAQDRNAAAKAVLGLKPQDLIVFLMDVAEDASPYIESRVLDTVLYLASVKRRVAVLLRSTRASDAAFDERLRQAREKGVSFVRYDDIAVTEEMDRTVITAFDGKLSVTLETPLCIDCSELPDPEVEAFIETLRVKRFGGGGISGTRWYLTQGDTHKRNVKFINTIALDGDIEPIISALVDDLRVLDKPGQEKVASVDTKKCAFCYTCYRVCPHSALLPDEKASAMKVDEMLCAACGICLAVCPASAITFAGGAKAEAIEERRNNLKIFCCENSAFVASKEALAEVDASVESITCGGDISALMMTEALKTYDNVLVAVCCDDACKHHDGNKRLIKQVERLKERLEKLGHDPKRISCVQTGITMTNLLRNAAEKALSGGGEK